MSLHRRLASQSTVIFGARLGGAGLIFLVQALIARLWGPELLGEYLVVIATVNLIAVVMPLGFHTVGTYFAAEYRARGERKQFVVFLTRSYGHVVGSLVLILLAGPWVLDLIGQGDSVLAHHFVPVALLAFSTAMVYVNGALLVGLKRPFAGFFADTMFRPMIVVASFLVCLGFAVPADGFSFMLWLIAFGYLGISLVHFGFVVTSIKRLPDTLPLRLTEAKRWWRFALPWVLISLATDFFFDIDLLLLSHSLTREELAIFGVCTRLFSLISFGVAAVYAVTMPDMFESEANADRAAFKRKVGDANFVASAISVALFFAMLLAAPILMMIFGPSFAAGAGPLAVLSLALVIRSMMGPASLVLSIHDRPYASLPFVALGIGTLVIANFILVPAYGLMGAALAAIISITVWSVGQWWVALRTAHMDVSIMAWVRSRRDVVVAAE
ncbi:MAG: polysaccharide biosynthesis C-terminal domain-containing protein [Candidatus Devosia phytovorans]|uniref:Polysaccharide biosynthesis C-terminal domain-containing protein n=1 Tax=Candidatus Devosia phytovorans TaxID=3121372 RepID=A0AAJ5VWR8_9HYPH|nr:polysaccharide biosynthesis C-terminal domain-containing protein [Devosia sp.]WEK05506.1 MAG: polysaccharide biosynthesis C-terminal domain-containing protein [Devosia sp.]